MKPSPTSSRLLGLRVLVVEDEFMVADYISMLLEDFGCSVAGPVATIPEALNLVRGGGLDGAVLDVNLDGHSSAPIAAELHANSVPFVVVTGYGGLKLESGTLNDAPRLAKPFSKYEFERTLAAAFRA